MIIMITYNYIFNIFSNKLEIILRLYTVTVRMAVANITQ